MDKKQFKSERVVPIVAGPFGDVHPVIDIEGIGLEYGERLHSMGIINTQQLWEANAADVSLATGVPIKTVHRWQEMAELASVKYIGPQYAELLERSGIHSIDQLKKYDPDELLRILHKKQNSLKINIQGNNPGHDTVEHWIDEAARSHRYTGA